MQQSLEQLTISNYCQNYYFAIMTNKINISLFPFFSFFFLLKIHIPQGSLTEIHRELCAASESFPTFHGIEIRKGLQKLRNATLNRSSKQQQENALVRLILILI